jgi:hypothetical protein
MMAQLWVEGPLPGMNEIVEAAKGAGGVGKHYANLKKAWTDTVWALALQARLPKFPGRVVLRFEWFEADKRRDPDNFAAAKKFLLDGLVKAGVLKGDDWRYIESFSDYWRVWTSVPMCRGPGVQVTIEEPTPTVHMG